MKLKIKQFEIWIADLNPRLGTEAGKIRPVIVVQTDLLTSEHQSTIICPITSQIQKDAHILRVHLKMGMAGLVEDCDIMIDQIRAIDNSRLRERIGMLPESVTQNLKKNLKIILDL